MNSHHPNEASLPLEAARWPFAQTILLVWCSVAVLSSLYGVIPLFSVFELEFHAPMTATAWTGTAFSLGYMLGCIGFGAFMDRFGTRPVLISGLFMLAIVTPLIGLAANLPSLIAMRALQGCMAASFAPAALAYVTQTYPARSKVMTLGYISTGLLSAGVIGQVVSSVIEQAFGWRFVFFALGWIYLASAILVLLMLSRNKSAPVQPVNSLFIQYKKVLTNSRLYVPFLITITVLFAFVAMYTLLQVRLSSETFGLSSPAILRIRAFGLLGIVLSPLAGRVIHWLGFAGTLRFNLALSAISCLIIGLTSSIPVIILFSITFVIGIALTTPTLVALVSRLAPTVSTLAINLYSLILFLGAAAGPVAAAYSIPILGLAGSFAGLSIILLIAFLCTWSFYKGRL